MDLGSKLNMLTGNGSLNDLDLMGVEESKPKIVPEQAPDEPEEEQVLDFNLGMLSIDAYLAEDPAPKQKKSGKSKSSGPLIQKTKSPFDGFFDGLEDEEDPPLTGKYRTGNRDLDEATARSRKLLEQADMLRAENFDSFLDDEEAFTAEEDAELRNHLVSMGRKYARDTASTAESSEITKAYAGTEKHLHDLLQEVSRDKSDIQRDIERLRVPGRAGKMLSEMVEAKNTLHNTQLGIIKEMNSMKKTIFDLRAKEAARKEAENAGANDISTNTIQSIFSNARNNLVDSMGGYEMVSGAEDDSDEPLGYVDNSDSDEEIQRKYFSKKDRPTTDGDKFLQYEDRGVELVLIVDSDYKPQFVLAEDSNGVMIPDYPVPKNIQELEFDIDQIAKTATDNCQRPYNVRVEV